jgi:hypothetical protein
MSSWVAKHCDAVRSLAVTCDGTTERSTPTSTNPKRPSRHCTPILSARGCGPNVEVSSRDERPLPCTAHCGSARQYRSNCCGGTGIHLPASLPAMSSSPATTSSRSTTWPLPQFSARRSTSEGTCAATRATGLAAEHVLPFANRNKGARGVRRLRTALDLMDAGAQSPKETWLRLLLIDAGFPRPKTQIPVLDDCSNPFAYLDLGWDDVMIAVEYDGDQHRTDRARYAWDVKLLRRIQQLGWFHIKVISEDSRYDIIERVAHAWRLREPREPIARAANRPA